jgi:hypothetical protein
MIENLNFGHNKINKRRNSKFRIKNISFYLFVFLFYPRQLIECNSNEINSFKERTHENNEQIVFGRKIDLTENDNSNLKIHLDDYPQIEINHNEKDINEGIYFYFRNLKFEYPVFF